MKTQEWTFMDKHAWPLRGEWDKEPDKVQWQDEDTGLPCLAVRNHSNWCGYVGVSLGHPLYGMGCGDDATSNLDVHGGITFGGKCQENKHGICHIVEPGEPDDVWWLGFDCAHSGDYRPPTDQYYLDLELRFPMPRGYETYRSLEYVKDQVRNLAAQLILRKESV